MQQSKRRCTPEKRRRLVAVLDRSERDVLDRSATESYDHQEEAIAG
jgi:hypothetical protein